MSIIASGLGYAIKGILVATVSIGGFAVWVSDSFYGNTSKPEPIVATTNTDKETEWIVGRSDEYDYQIKLYVGEKVGVKQATVKWRNKVIAIYNNGWVKIPTDNADFENVQKIFKEVVARRSK